MTREGPKWNEGPAQRHRIENPTLAQLDFEFIAETLNCQCKSTETIKVKFKAAERELGIHTNFLVKWLASQTHFHPSPSYWLSLRESNRQCREILVPLQITLLQRIA